MARLFLPMVRYTTVVCLYTCKHGGCYATVLCLHTCSHGGCHTTAVCLYTYTHGRCYAQNAAATPSRRRHALMTSTYVSCGSSASFFLFSSMENRCLWWHTICFASGAFQFLFVGLPVCDGVEGGNCTRKPLDA